MQIFVKSFMCTKASSMTQMLSQICCHISVDILIRIWLKQTIKKKHYIRTDCLTTLIFIHLYFKQYVTASLKFTRQLKLSCFCCVKIFLSE